LDGDGGLAISIQAWLKGCIMPTVESYAQGTPCWVDLSSSDVDRSKEFYGSLFGWEFQANVMSPEMTYYMATLPGGNVAGLMAQMADQASGGAPSAWTTYLAVDSAEEAAAKVAGAGGTLLAPADEVPGSGWMAIALDPAGALFGLWQAGGHIGASVVNEPGAVIWNELQVANVADVLPFYQTVAGLQSETGPAGDMAAYTQLTVDGRSIAGAMENPMPGSPDNWTVYFNVADADETVAKVQELGGTVVAPAFDATGVGRMAVLKDPQGATFAIMAAAG
jgi:uncharacterized protein